MSLTGNAEQTKDLRGKLNGLHTIRGYSAYEVALINGFSGTEEEWLASMNALHSVQAKMVDGVLVVAQKEN